MYSRLGNDVYLASVFSASNDSQSWRTPGAPVELRMDILTAQLSPRRFYRLWNEGLGINLTEAELNQWAGSISRFISLLPADLVAGDQVLISNRSGRCEVSINGVPSLVLEEGAFANLLLAAWIGKFPQSPELREGLTGMNADQKAAQITRLEQRHFASGRDALVRQWWAPALATAPEPEKPEAEKRADAQKPVAVAAGTAPVLAASAASVVIAAAEPEAPAKAPVPTPTNKAPAAKNEAAVTMKSVALNKGAESAPAKAAAAAPLTASVAATLAPSVAAQSQQPASVPAGQAVSPESPAQPAPNAAAMAGAIAEQRASVGYLRTVLRHANSKAEYPQRALKRRLQGVVMVGIRLDAQGQLLGLETVQSSGSELLDQAALRAARQAAPYPQPPEVLHDDALEFDIPFRFAMAE
ncbi:TonB family protein [Thalassolituus sp. LLYu03]|uniref:TonB family protein n=1 Tax=Thalassolituus sp. LLYu03 TaxID=3421656 RepID=UPI003D268BFE